MRVPSVGQPLYERRIVREGKRLAERMLAGYRVTANGRFVPENPNSGGLGQWIERLTGQRRLAPVPVRSGNKRRNS